MGILGIFLLVIFIISAILLIIVVLLQDEQGDGIGGLFGGGSNASFGPRSGNVLTRFTTILGVIFFVCCFGLAWVNRTTEEGDVLSAARRQQTADGTTEWWVTGSDTQEPAEAAAVPEPTGTMESVDSETEG